ncbi:MAG: FAD-dependent oxidoreductase [Desulfobacterales bacterium]|nr:MAG: FAD-dependent oxidoreductase [Desulfobacterales bacterium]
MTVTKNDLQHQFKFEVTAMPGGEVASRCFDCGTCAGVCPVSEAESAFDPRRIIHMIKMGLKDRLLGSEAIWYCSNCDTCAFVCPQEVQFSSVVRVLREMAVKEGYVDPGAFEHLGTGPCKASCPANISICGFITAISQGQYADGIKLIKREMPFPAVCGRVCPHPCEEACNRGKVDEPIAIEYLKRFLADVDLASDTQYLPEIKEQKEDKVAIVGAGPAGLTAAYYLAIDGYRVTIFERLPVAGGMMAVGIPEYRLPRNILQGEIDVIRNLGVEIKLNFEIGKDLSFEEMRKDYKAVFISVGCHQAMKLGIPGEDDFDGVVDCITFLREINLGTPPAHKGRLVVLGGGNAAIDSARVAKRLGYDDVVILYRRTREEMPASPWEIEDAIEEGIDIEFLTAPVRVEGSNGKATGLACIRMTMGEPDETGRRKPVPIEGSEFTVKADVIVAAIGQRSDLSFLGNGHGVDISGRNTIEADPVTAATNIPGIFAGGDVASGPRIVVEAVAFGKQAAISIDRYLKGEDIKSGRGENWKGMAFEPDHTEPTARQLMPRLPLAQRSRAFNEVDLGFKEEQAEQVAIRCLLLCVIQKGKEGMI